MEGYFRLRFGGLIFGRTYFWRGLLSAFYGSDLLNLTIDHDNMSEKYGTVNILYLHSHSGSAVNHSVHSSVVRLQLDKNQNHHFWPASSCSVSFLQQSYHSTTRNTVGNHSFYKYIRSFMLKDNCRN